MDGEEPEFSERSFRRERWAGTILAFLSTFFYGISNVAIRSLTDGQIAADADWILFWKEFIGLSLLIPWLIVRLLQGRFQYSSKRLALYIVIAAVFCQLIGAHLQVLGYAVIGLIISVPLIQSSTLLGVAVFGYIFLGDLLSRKRQAAIAVLITAVAILSIGKEMTAAKTDTVNAGLFLLVAAGTVLAGISYAAYITILRYSIRQFWKDENSTWLSFQFRHWIGHDHTKTPGQRFYSPFPVTLMMSIVFAVGLVIFGTALYGKHGAAGFTDVPAAAWYVIPVSATANLIGFFFQIQGLRVTTAVQASLIAVSQILMLSLIGFLCFHETVNMLVISGLVLTVYGVFMSAKPERSP
ncbi:MAG: DMT family transporter [Planctomycetaceae bacterium]|jgi:drug/metabolite transporter (DMT)-like permease|nr:DMT family transporter [Planctomycetaceae bacterium]